MFLKAVKKLYVRVLGIDMALQRQQQQFLKFSNCRGIFP